MATLKEPKEASTRIPVRIATSEEKYHSTLEAPVGEDRSIIKT